MLPSRTTEGNRRLPRRLLVATAIAVPLALVAAFGAATAAGLPLGR
jgi:hypothetical protein